MSSEKPFESCFRKIHSPHLTSNSNQHQQLPPTQQQLYNNLLITSIPMVTLNISSPNFLLYPPKPKPPTRQTNSELTDHTKPLSILNRGFVQNMQYPQITPLYTRTHSMRLIEMVNHHQVNPFPSRRRPREHYCQY